MGIFSKSPYRSPPDQPAPLPPPRVLPNKIDTTFFNMEATFTFADSRAFDASFEHDPVPEDWVDGGAYILDSGPPHRSAESYLDSFVHTAYQKGFFTFSSGVTSRPMVAARCSTSWRRSRRASPACRRATTRR